MERREDVLEEYVQLDSLLFITCPILSRLQDLFDDPECCFKLRRGCRDTLLTLCTYSYCFFSDMGYSIGCTFARKYNLIYRYIIRVL